jgi:DNA-binding NarL/FixJ family response regulator
MQRTEQLAVIAESHGFYTSGWANLLRQNLGISSVAANNLEQTIQALDGAEGANLLIIDATLPGVRGVQTMRMLRGQFPDTPILLTFSQMDRETVFEFIAAGAHGLVPKSAASSDVLLALRTVMAGQIFVPTSVREQTSPRFTTGSLSDDPDISLTPRQSEIVALLCEGKSNKAIARDLGISPSTVKVHLHAAFRSLGVNNRLGAASASFGRQLAARTAQIGFLQVGEQLCELAD